VSTELKKWYLANFDSKFELKQIKAVLLKASDVYYNSESSLMSDEKYDTLRTYYEKNSGETLPVGAKPSVSNTCEISHEYENFAGTLSKCQTIEELKAWVKNKKVDKTELLVTTKADGHSVVVEFTTFKGKPKIVKALTRGENGVGKDLTKLFLANAKQVPVPIVPMTGDYAIGYEAVVTYNDFAYLSHATNNKYKNPRSSVGGILSNSGADLFPYITLIPIKIAAKGKALSRQDQLNIILEMKYSDLLEAELMDLQTIIDYYEMLEGQRLVDDKHKGIMYDGLVIESMDEVLRLKLGHTSTEPNYATALKFTPISRETNVIDVIWSVEGHSARFTPVVNFHPVVIRGNTYKQVSLANYGRFKELDLHVTSPIEFALRNDTLGYVEKIEGRNLSLGSKLKAPTTCPSCKHKLEVKTVFLECINSDCTFNKVADIYAFVDKVGIKNVGLEMIRALYDAKILDNIVDLLTIETKKKRISSLEQFGQRSADNIYKEVNKVLSKPIKDYVFYGSLNVSSAGRSRFKDIFKEFNSKDLIPLMESGQKKFISTLIKIHGIGDSIALAIFERLMWLRENDILDTLLECLSVESTFKPSNGGISNSYCHTGNALPFKDRASLEAYLESKGHKLVGGVTSKTTALINNDSTSTSGKNLKAIELGKPIYTVQDIIDQFGEP
jgi:DNA ligase (NAD+)